MANKKFDDAELLTDDELERVAGGFGIATPFNFKPYIPQQIQELVRQAQENSSTNQVNRELLQ